MNGEQEYMGQGSLSEAYSNMHKQQKAERQAEIDSMLNIVLSRTVSDVVKAVEVLYDAGYRRKR